MYHWNLHQWKNGNFEIVEARVVHPKAVVLAFYREAFSPWPVWTHTLHPFPRHYLP